MERLERETEVTGKITFEAESFVVTSHKVAFLAVTKAAKPQEKASNAKSTNLRHSNMDIRLKDKH